MFINELLIEMEKKDFERIGVIVVFYFRVWFWCNFVFEIGDIFVEWLKYVMFLKYDLKSCGNWDILRLILNLFIICYLCIDVGNFLLEVYERFVVLKLFF